jgi:hypothetical protein
VVVRVSYRFALGGVSSRFHSRAAEDRIVACPVYPLALLVQVLCIRVDAVEALVSRRARYREARTGSRRYRRHYRGSKSRVNRRDRGRHGYAVIALVLLRRKEPVEVCEMAVFVGLHGEPAPEIVVGRARSHCGGGRGNSS